MVVLLIGMCSSQFAANVFALCNFRRTPNHCISVINFAVLTGKCHSNSVYFYLKGALLLLNPSERVGGLKIISLTSCGSCNFLMYASSRFTSAILDFLQVVMFLTNL